MTNEEAKEQYFKAVSQYEAKNFAGALALFDELDRDRPNSRHVIFHRAMCLAGLQEIDAAQECCDRLAGKLGEKEMRDLQAAIAAARAKARAEAEARPAAPPPQPEGTNVLNVESVYPVSTHETTVIGHVAAGVFRVGDAVTIVSPEGATLRAPILRIGTAETPLNLVRAGQRAVMLLKVEPNLVAPGAPITSDADEESYAATMMVGTEEPNVKSTAGGAHAPELVEAEKCIRHKEFDKARAALDAFLAREPNNGPAHRFMARVHLESEGGDVKKALEFIRRAFELGGSDDPAVIDVLAQALGANNEAEHGLRFLERLYLATTAFEARSALAQRIGDYREKFKLGHVWELADGYGDVIFETGNIDDIAKALGNGTLPKDGKCRRDHIGEWRPIESALAPEHPQIAAHYAPAKHGPNYALLVGAGVLAAIVAAAFILLR